jgi:hypothetical protein
VPGAGGQVKGASRKVKSKWAGSLLRKATRMGGLGVSLGGWARGGMGGGKGRTCLALEDVGACAHAVEAEDSDLAGLVRRRRHVGCGFCDSAV